MKNLYYILTLIVISFTSCREITNKEEKVVETKNLEPELLLETEHCRYYCLARNGFDTCKIVICECDEGYSCDASTSW